MNATARYFDDEAPTPVLEVNLRRLLLRCEQRQREASRRRLGASSARTSAGERVGLQGGESEAAGAPSAAGEAGTALLGRRDETLLMTHQCSAMKVMLRELQDRRRIAVRKQRALAKKQPEESDGALFNQGTASSEDAELRLLARRCNRMIGLMQAMIDAASQTRHQELGATSPPGDKAEGASGESSASARDAVVAVGFRTKSHETGEDDPISSSGRSTNHENLLSRASHHDLMESRQPRRRRSRPKSSNFQEGVAFQRELNSWKAELGLLNSGCGDEELSAERLEAAKNALEEDLLETTSSLKALANSSKEAIQEDLERIERTKDMADSNLDKVEKLTKKTKKNTKAAWGGFMTEIMLLLTAAGMTAGVVLLMRIPGFGKNW